MNAFLSTRKPVVRKIIKASKVAKESVRKRTPSLIRQPVKLGKKLIWGAAKLATLIFIGRL